MTCRKVAEYNGRAGRQRLVGGSASSPLFVPFSTEAECNQACKEGACCEGTTCTVKPQCQCVPSGVCCGPDTVDVSGTSAPRCRSESESQCIQRGGTWVVGGNCVRDEKTGAAGAWCAALTGTPNKVFKGVGTTCSPNPCGRCGCITGIVNAQTITLSISNASLLFSPQDPGAVGYDQLRNGGSCVNDSAVIQWLNSITVSLSDTTDPITGVQSWKGQATTQSHLSSVLVECVLGIGCDGAASLTVKFCPDGSNSQTCMRQQLGDLDILRFNVGDPCTGTTAGVAGFFGQAVATFSAGGCRLGPGGLVAFRGFNVPYTITANPLP